jgi:hypothetical protein
MNISRLPIAAVASLGLAFGMASLAPAHAQTAPAPAQAPAQSAMPAENMPSENFSDEQLRSFAVATLQIQDVGQEYQPRMEAAESTEEQQALAQEANAQMVQIVEQVEGITVPEYNAIAEAARANPEVMQQINTLIGEEAQ